MAKLSECFIGAVFGRLTVKELLVSRSEGRSRKFAYCLCLCGKTLKTRIDGLGVSALSCGCLNSENTAAKGKANKVHGMHGTPEYKSWAEMWARTTNPNHKKYAGYKDRAPPEEWKDFRVFYAALGPKPAGYTLERINNALPYGPGNCKWASKAEQAKNTSRVRRFQYEGKNYTLAELTRYFGLTHGAMSHQHYTNKRPLHEVFGLAEHALIELPQC